MPREKLRKDFREVGVVEGFYGRVWSHRRRSGFIEALLPFGLNTYLYCPKEESALGAGVGERLSRREEARLGGLAEFCHARQIRPWAGLRLSPPLDLAAPAAWEAVALKCSRLTELGFSGLTLLFDDMPAGGAGGDGSTAALHGRVVREIIERAGAADAAAGAEWLVCPALYSLDPILEREYGPFEQDYLPRLDREMPPEAGWLWTGPRVVSPRITLADLEAWRGGLSRRTVLWDNYPVNDAAMAASLHLGPLTGRAPDLPQGLGGYLFNPLLQPALGAVPGAACLAYGRDPAGYDPAEAWRQALGALLPPGGRGAFTALEALTRSSRLAAAEGSVDKEESGELRRKIEKAWQEHHEGARLEPGAAEELGELLESIGKELPPAMLKEAQPWLKQLEWARALMWELSLGGKGGSETAAYRRGRPRVLGEWFDP